jgi:hypothetical protein
MKLRALPLMTALLLGTALVPLAGCDRDVDAVHAEKDAKGNTTVHVDGEKVDQNFDQAEKKFDQAGEQIKEGAQQAGAQLKAPSRPATPSSAAPTRWKPRSDPWRARSWATPP